MKEQTVKETTEKVDKIKKYFAFYRNQRRENFSDSEVVYEVPLTEVVISKPLDIGRLNGIAA